ncbi:putative cytokinetic ring protein SteA [Arsenicicoccus dermatophilus]|uniref:putative cytokinetic ring protein SteA n=1 Tax=Arsenicicoccus dermatophilus TaxID=1076331 RepID=UPI001F4CBAA4|nr:putative cytokinetic ring protein SteA [Arsenicicoccus dermatophilus]MCH8613177.1 putative cytokinetic ring protein SteA [Arsenicicoccus dermatophilus]
MSTYQARGRAARDGSQPVGRPVRVDRRTKDLTKRLRPGDLAVIDHADIDRVSAEALVACQPAAVLNAARSTTGRYPNLGPQILHDAGILHVDDLGPEVMALTEGTLAEVQDGALVVDGRQVASGTVQTAQTIEADQTLARIGLSHQLEAFAANTMEYLKRERALLLDGVGIPDIVTPIKGRHVLVVVRGYHYKEDLRTLQHYIREYKPVLIGVDGGADALREIGRRPDLIVGDMDSVSDEALRCGAEVVVHAYRDGRAPGLDRVRSLGVEPVVFPATGTSEDIAMLLADDAGAELIVAVGTHATLVEFLDKGRAGMASTFLTRLRVGSKLVDAKGVSRLYRSRISAASLVFLVLAGLLALTAALAATPGGQAMLQAVWARWDDFVSWLGRLLT